MAKNVASAVLDGEMTARVSGTDIPDDLQPLLRSCFKAGWLERPTMKDVVKALKHFGNEGSSYDDDGIRVRPGSESLSEPLLGSGSHV